MAETQADMTPTQFNPDFLKKAEELKPILNTKVVKPGFQVEFTKKTGESLLHDIGIKSSQKVSYPIPLKERGNIIYLDFNQHLVGYLKVKFVTKGNPQDAPVKVRFRFGEVPSEIIDDNSDYKGWISDTWFQEAIEYVDFTPYVLELRRRYCFRYLSIELLGKSDKTELFIDEISTTMVSSASLDLELQSKTKDKMLDKIDYVSKVTLRDCMQDVFEDGPKRDRRLWLGDLRLQALTNYSTFKNYDLVKRCLYLFAGTTDINGRVSSTIFIEPSVVPDTIYLYDYYLLFIPTLYEYYEASRDKETLKELYNTAERQLYIGLEKLESIDIENSNDWWVFIDWHRDLNKLTSAFAILIYAYNYYCKIANELNYTIPEEIENRIQKVKEIALKSYNKELGLYTSGPENQISYATQVWMILSEIVDIEQGIDILKKRLPKSDAIPITTPYLQHYYTEALIKVGLKSEAIDFIKEFWGGMINYGADTFWELFEPDNTFFSPYGSYLINSYCHAWSCTPPYLIDKYKLLYS